MFRLACVHTAATPRVIELLERELAANIGVPYSVSHHTAPEMIAAVIADGGVTPAVAAVMLKTFTLCLELGADAVLSVCSSVGDVADVAASAYASAGMRIVRIDEAMCRAAAARHRRIGVMGTLSTTLGPSRDLLARCAAEAGKDVEIVPILAEGGFGKSQKDLDAYLCETARKRVADVDAFVLAQASMALSEETMRIATGLEIYSSPRHAAAALGELARRQGAKER